MIDTHTHILYDVDDGSRSLEESIAMIAEAQNMGITDIVLTPHYICNSVFQNTKKQNEFRFKVLKEETIKRGYKINLMLGNEIFIDDSIDQLLNDGLIATLNDSKYILIEFPIMFLPHNARQILFDLRLKGYIPIIAHPERYHFYEEIELVKEMKTQGILFQSNLGTLLGNYGKSANKRLKKMLKANLIDIMASDIHHSETMYQELPKALKKLKSIVGQDKLEKMIQTRPKMIIENLTIND